MPQYLVYLVPGRTVALPYRQRDEQYDSNTVPGYSMDTVRYPGNNNNTV